MIERKENDACIVTINAEKLARALAVNSWEIDTKMISSRDLWVKVANTDGSITEEVHPKWASDYWNLVTQYRELIELYKVENHDNNQVNSQDNQTGHTG